MLWKVSIHPDLHHSSLVDSDVVFFYLEVSKFLTDLLEAVKRLEVEMDGIWVGNMLDIWQSDGSFFNEEGGVVTGGAELVLALFLEVGSRYELFMIFSHLEYLLLFFELLVLLGNDVVLL